jgi:hypothetical protein
LGEALLLGDVEPLVSTGLAVAGLLVALFGWTVDPRSPTTRAILVALLGGVVTYSVLSFFIPDPWRKGVARGVDTRVVMTRPGSRVTIPRRVIVEGESRNLPPGSVLWAAHRATNETVFYIANGPCLVEKDYRTFSCPEMLVGPDEDRRSFEIVVWVANGDAQNALLKRLITNEKEDFSGYLTAPPDGAQSGASVIKARS